MHIRTNQIVLLASLLAIANAGPLPTTIKPTLPHSTPSLRQPATIAPAMAVETSITSPTPASASVAIVKRIDWRGDWDQAKAIACYIFRW